MPKNTVQFQKGLSLSNFLSEYDTEEQCFSALVNLRWPNGFVCPKCGCKTYCSLTRNKLFQCNGCRSQISITSGTIFHSTKLPLTKWFLAQYLMTQGKNGISQLELGRSIGVSIKAAAMLYHKLAQVMLERDTKKPLSGKIEIDDAYWGGKQKGKRGRGSTNKTPFIAAVEKTKDGKPKRVLASGMCKACHRSFYCQRCQRFDAPKKISGLCDPCYNAWDARTTTDWKAFLKEGVHG